MSLVRCPGLGLGLLGLAGHVAVDNIRHGKKLISADAVKLSVNNCCKKVKVAADSDSSKIVKVRELF